MPALEEYAEQNCKPAYKILACFGVVIIVSAFLYCIYDLFTQFPIATAIGVPLVFLSLAGLNRWYSNKLHTHFQTLAAQRKGESICQFARQANCRENDPWVVRAVYEEMASEMAHYTEMPDFPVRWNDDIEKTLKLFLDDIDDLLPCMARRAGRDLTNTKKNPWFDKVSTVGDLVQFLNAQPRLSSQ